MCVPIKYWGPVCKWMRKANEAWSESSRCDCLCTGVRNEAPQYTRIKASLLSYISKKTFKVLSKQQRH